MFFKKSNASAAFSSFQNKEFIFYLLARLGFILGAQMQYTIVGWQVKLITNDALSLGLLGLAEAIPFLCIAPFAGHIADIIDRKKIIITATFFLLSATALLVWFSSDNCTVLQTYGALPIYVVIFMTGIARGFIGPTYFAILPQIVERDQIPNAATWSSTTFHISAVMGPALGGLLLGFIGMEFSYIFSFLLIGASILFIMLIKSKGVPPKINKEPFGTSLLAGIRFVYKNQIVFSALSLDLFAVLFGGAIALLPIFATDILHVGETGFGLLRAAPAFGAIVMSGFLAYSPLKKNAGVILLWAVSAFGICMILFALSRNFYLSLLILAMSGAFDNISVVVRQIILQLSTPDNMRGRVSAVNSMFIGSSNEIGAFESGVAARLLGLIPSVIFGGSMTIIIVGIIAKLSPKLRKMDLEKI